MTEHNKEQHCCVHEREFGQLLSTMERISKEFYGNGKDGILQIVAKTNTQLEELSNTLKAQATVLSAISKTITETQAVEAYKGKTEEMSWKKAAVLVSGILGICSIVTAIIIKFA